MLVVRRPVEQWSTYFGERWLPQLRAGGVDIQVLPVFIDDEFRPEGSLRETLRMIEAAHRLAEGNASDVALCRDGAEIDAALAAGKIALVLALEGCPQVDDDVELLETVARLGVRVVSFAHFGRSALADGSAENATGSRLTRSGVEALALLESLGVIIDISHVGYSGVDHILELATRPIIATHSSAHAVRDHHRNLDDTQLKAVADTGGVVCVNFFAGFLDAEDPTMDRLVDHIAHIAGTIGIEHVGIGPDFVREVYDEKVPMCDRPVLFDGVDVMRCVPGLDGPTGLPLVTEALLDRGFSERDVRLVLGGNVHRLFQAELGRPRP
ncbi:MAG: dipeptidase [Actinomycetota bacterium]|nr:dipeptidase [Actinomycetota bacterium]